DKDDDNPTFKQQQQPTNLTIAKQPEHFFSNDNDDDSY
ncbi:hypothetical protein DERP_004098, partial [Dermatophagoides pteronyssinus]